MSRHERRRDRSRYRKVAQTLITYLVDAQDPLADLPVLARGREWWLAGLPTVPMRHCFHCHADIWGRDDVGALLAAIPASDPRSVGLNGLCRRCWDAEPFDLDAVAVSAGKVLATACRGGKFEPLRNVS